MVALVGIALLPMMQHSPMPSFHELDLLIHWESTPGTSRPEMTRVVALAGRELRSIDGVRNVGGHVGRAVLSDQVVGIDAGELWVSIDPDANYDATLAEIRKTIAGYPGLDPELIRYSAERVRAILPEDEGILTVRIYGHDSAILLPKAQELGVALDAIDGLSNPRIDRAVEEPTVEVQVNLADAQRFGITLRCPADGRRPAVSSRWARCSRPKVFEVMVVGRPELRNSVDDIGSLLIDTPDGGHVALGDVAEVRITSAPSSIHREGNLALRGCHRHGQRARSERDRCRCQQQARIHVLPDRVPPRGDGRPRGRPVQQPGLARRGSRHVVIGVLLLLQAAFGSWRLAIATLLVLPVALTGGVVAAFLTGGVFDGSDPRPGGRVRDHGASRTDADEPVHGRAAAGRGGLRH